MITMILLSQTPIDIHQLGVTPAGLLLVREAGVPKVGENNEGGPSRGATVPKRFLWYIVSMKVSNQAVNSDPSFLMHRA